MPALRNTPFDNLLGAYQGRLRPGVAPAADGSHVWCMGMDLTPRAEALRHGDYIQIDQQIDVTDITYLRAQVWMRQSVNLDRRTFPNTVEFVALNSSTITNVVSGSPGIPARVTTAGKHYLVTGETVVIRNVVGVLFVNGRFTVTRINDFQFDLDGVEGSGTYVSGGSLGRGERIYTPAGWTKEEYQRTLDVSGSNFANNNGQYRVLGFQTQPGVDPPRLAYVERPTGTPITADDIATSPSLAVTGRGNRWKISLMVDTGGGFVERSRVVQNISQGGFFRTDLGAYVRRLTGPQNFAIRCTLVQHESNNVYNLPPQP